jgi:hypothetical protein
VSWIWEEYWLRTGSLPKGLGLRDEYIIEGRKGRYIGESTCWLAQCAVTNRTELRSLAFGMQQSIAIVCIARQTVELSDRARKLCDNFMTSELANISHALTITQHTSLNLKIIKPIIPNIVIESLRSIMQVAIFPSNEICVCRTRSF